MMIDSLEMTEEDRQLIVRNCGSCDETRIVVTHGTDTMVETASALARGTTGKTIVLTGAMIPYAFGSSDGFFNLGSALVRAGAAGGRLHRDERQCFEWDKVRRTPRPAPSNQPEPVDRFGAF